MIYAIKNSFDWRNQLSRSAIMIFCMFTANNIKPVIAMRRGDVEFKHIGTDKYVFDSEKGRALWQKQDTEIGFTKRGKDFIVTWLLISERITGYDLAQPLFPYNKQGRIVHFPRNNPQATLNTHLINMGCTSITSSRFRKTKADLLMATTNDVYLTAISLSCSINNIATNYAHGVKANHEQSLCASMSAQEAMARGTEKTKALNDAKHKYKPVLSDFEYQKIRGDKNDPVT